MGESNLLYVAVVYSDSPLHLGVVAIQVKATNRVYLLPLYVVPNWFWWQCARRSTLVSALGIIAGVVLVSKTSRSEIKFPSFNELHTRTMP